MAEPSIDSLPSIGDREVFEAVWNEGNLMVILLDREGRIVRFNRACETTSGYPASEAIGRRVDFLIPPEQQEGVEGAFRELLEGGRLERFENDWVTRDGARRRIVWSSTFLKGSDGKVGHVVGTGIDVTELRVTQEELDIARHVLDDTRHALAGEKRFSDAIVETAVDAIITIDARGTVESFNPAAERLFGYRPAEVIGNNISMLMPSPYQEEHDGYLRKYLETGERKIIGIGREAEGRRKDGTAFPIYLAVSEIVEEDGSRRFAGIVRDLTEIKTLQANVLRSEHLASIGEMAASVAHEIKNPLAAISGVVQVIRRGMTEEDPRRGVIGQVMEQIHRLDRTIRDLLAFSRSWSPRKRPCDLWPVAAQVVESVRAEPEFRGIDFTVEGDREANVPLDAGQFEQVLWNLIQNAAQAMGGAGAVTVTIRKTDAGATVHVADDGPGMPDAVRRKAFQPFFTTKTKGTGLGLAICKRIVEAHGGTVDLESTPGAGTAFTLVFPGESQRAEATSDA